MKGSILLLRRREYEPTVTQGELANALKVSSHTIACVEANKIGLDEETYARWEAAIDEIARSRQEETKDGSNDGN